MILKLNIHIGWMNSFPCTAYILMVEYIRSKRISELICADGNRTTIRKYMYDKYKSAENFEWRSETEAEKSVLRKEYRIIAAKDHVQYSRHYRVVFGKGYNNASFLNIKIDEKRF